MNPLQFDLIGIGECMVEFRNELVAGRTDLMRRAWGGDVLNTLVHASRIGLRTSFQTRVGDDPFGSWMRDGWVRAGVDVARAPIVPGENGLYFITNDTDGERSFAYRRAGSAASELAPGDMERAWLDSGRHVLLSGITQAISASAEQLVAAAARHVRARAAGLYDPNFRPQLWAHRGGDAAAQRAFRAVAPGVGWLLPSYPADAVLATGTDDAPADEALEAFARVSAGGNVAMKMGADGVLLCVRGSVSHVPAAPVDKIVDSTGAGDAWNAAFVAALCRGASAAAAARGANDYAAGVLGYAGAVPSDLHAT